MWKKIICCCSTPKVQRVDEGEWFEPVLPKKRKKHNSPQSSRPRSDKLRTRSDKILQHQCRSSMNNSSSRSSRLSSMKQLSPLLEEEDTSLTEESSSSGSDGDEHQMYMNDDTSNQRVKREHKNKAAEMKYSSSVKHVAPQLDDCFLVL